jgi:hypothetical protein
MEKFAPLSARRRLKTTDIDPIVNDFLRAPIHLDPDAASVGSSDEEMRRSRRGRPAAARGTALRE